MEKVFTIKIWITSIVFAVSLVISFGSIAQDLVKGKIVDEENAPLPGVTVLLKDSQKGTITDIDGNYSIEAGPK